MAIATYSLKQAGREHKLSEHFALGEFACHDGSDLVLVSEDLVKLLEKIRAWARTVVSPDAVVIITSGYRTTSYNAAVKGKSNSRHILGEAADFKIAYGPKGSLGKYMKFVEPKRIAKALDNGEVTGAAFIGGMGLYRSWLHVDVRSSNTRWKG